MADGDEDEFGETSLGGFGCDAWRWRWGVYIAHYRFDGLLGGIELVEISSIS